MDRILHEATLVCFDSGHLRRAHRRDGRANAYPLAHTIEEGRGVACPEDHAHAESFSHTEGVTHAKSDADTEGFAESNTVAESGCHAETFTNAKTFSDPQAVPNTETDSGDEARRRTRHRRG